MRNKVTDSPGAVSDEERQFNRMTQTPVAALVLQLGLPTTISMLVTNIYNLVDTDYVSELGTSQSGAIGVVFALMAIIQAFGFMFGHGAGSNIGRLLGAHETEKAGRFGSTSMFMGLVSGLMITVFGFLFQPSLMRLLGSTETILPYAIEYSRYILLAAPFMVISCIMNNILRYEGRATYAMIGLVSGAVINIFGDWYLIRECELGVGGAGISTAVSQVISCGILAIPFIRNMTQTRFRIKNITLKWNFIWLILSIGFPSMMRQGLNSISTMILNGMAKPYGDAAIAAMSIVARVIGLMFCVGLGIGQGFQPVCGFNYGSRKYERVKKSYWFTFTFSMCFLGLIGAVGFIFAQPIMLHFSEEAQVVSIGTAALRFQTLSLICMPMTVTGNMLFQSVGKSGRATFLAATRSGLYFIPVILITGNLLGIRGIESAQAIADVLAAITTLPIVLSFLHKLPEDGVGAEAM